MIRSPSEEHPKSSTHSRLAKATIPRLRLHTLVLPEHVNYKNRAIISQICREEHEPPPTLEKHPTVTLLTAKAITHDKTNVK